MSFFTIRDIGMFLGNGSKYLFVLCFRVLSKQYFDRSAYANVFKLNREKKRFERAKVNSTSPLVSGRHVGVPQRGSNMASP